MLHLFILFDNQSMNLNYLYGAFIFVYIFIYSLILDNKSHPLAYGTIKLFIFTSMILHQNLSWFGLDLFLTALLFTYISTSIFLPTIITKKYNLSIINN